MLAVTAAYINVTFAGYCGYDDFNESFRAAFFDGPVPSRIVTALHFTGFMYRPVTSALQLATWQGFAHQAIGFRLRDLVSHLVNVVLVYAIAFRLVRMRSIAAASALLFGLNPYANEAVAVAIWTNTTAYAFFFGALLLFLQAAHVDSGDARSARLWLAGSFALALVALFTYEPTIVLFGAEIVMLAICLRAVSRAFLIAFGVALGIDLVLFFAIRHAIHVQSAPLLPIPVILKSLFEYLAALALPADPVLAHAVAGTPFPVSGGSFGLSHLIVPGVVALVLAGIAVAMRARQIRPLVPGGVGSIVLALALSIPLTLVPIVAFRAHVSEFNLYIPAALFAIIVAICARQLMAGRAGFIAIVAVLCISYGAGSVVRNARVVACARIVDTIFSQLPVDAWRQGTWHVRLATPVDQILTPPYGIYDYSGVQTLEITPTRIKGAQEAIDLASGNTHVTVDVVAAAALERGCARVHTCFFINTDGTVKEVNRR